MTVKKIFIRFCNNIRHFSNEINKPGGWISFCGGWNFSKSVSVDSTLIREMTNSCKRQWYRSIEWRKQMTKACKFPKRFSRFGQIALRCYAGCFPEVRCVSLAVQSWLYLIGLVQNKELRQFSIYKMHSNSNLEF